MLHGGPDDHDTDAFEPEVAGWVDQGFVVVRVNYRGSTATGAPGPRRCARAWGLTELEDIAAVRQWTVDQKITDPDWLSPAAGPGAVI